MNTYLHNKGGAGTDALVVIGFFIGLFVLWIVVGGPAQNPTSLFINEPLDPYVINTSTTSISSATTTIATSSDPLANLDPERVTLVIAFLATFVLLLAAKFHTSSSE